MKSALVGTIKGTDQVYDTVFETGRGNVVFLPQGTGDITSAAGTTSVPSVL